MTTSVNFVNVVSNNLTESDLVIFPTKHIFMGSINNSNFKIYRLKKLAWFDYNITEFRGTIYNHGKMTKIRADFSLLWIYKHIVTIMFFAFAIIDVIILLTDSTSWSIAGLIVLAELLVLGQLRIRNRIRFKKDKQRYVEIMQSLYEIVELKNAR